MKWVNLIPYGIAAIAALAFAAAFFRANLSKSTIEIYTRDNSALRSRVETLEDEKEELINKINKMETRMTTLENQNKVLADVVTGSSALQRLADLTAENHTSTIKILSDIINLLGDRRETSTKEKS